jgi:hypothetical protein
MICYDDIDIGIYNTNMNVSSLMKMSLYINGARPTKAGTTKAGSTRGPDRKSDGTMIQANCYIEEPI